MELGLQLFPCRYVNATSSCTKGQFIDVWMFRKNLTDVCEPVTVIKAQLLREMANTSRCPATRISVGLEAAYFSRLWNGWIGIVTAALLNL